MKAGPSEVGDRSRGTVIAPGCTVAHVIVASPKRSSAPRRV